MEIESARRAGVEEEKKRKIEIERRMHPKKTGDFDILYNELPYVISQHITFGSPRVGNDIFFEYFKTYGIYSKRITHHYDIVPHVPEEFLGYEHVNNEIWYDETNEHFSICDDYMHEDPLCSNSCAPTKCTSTSDHLNYLNISMGNDGLC